MKNSFKNLMREFGQKFLIVIMTVSLIASTLALIPPKKVEAQEIVYDPANAALKKIGNGILAVINQISTAVIGKEVTALAVKEYILDPIAYSIAKMILHSMAQSVIAWASNGFQGNPAFVQNPKQFFANAADQAIGQLLYDSESLSWMCSPFQFQLKRALIFSRSFQQQSQCTLTGVINNFDSFVSGVNNELGTLGGWDAWNVMTTQPQNNPYGAFALLSAQAEAKITGSKERSLLEINLGGGFLSWKDPACVSSANTARQAIDEGDEAAITRSNPDFGPPVNTDPSNCNTLTPGSIIADQINETLSTPGKELIAADEINEVIGAIMVGLLKQVLGGSGLFGAGQSSSGSGESAYLAQFTVEDRQYFEKTKTDNINQIVNASSAENRYIATKNQSIGRIELSANRARDIISCYQVKLTGNNQTLDQDDQQTAQQEITNASSTLSTILSYEPPIKRDVALGEANLVNAKKITDAISATTYESRDRLSTIMEQFSSLFSQLHSEGDVIGAEYERDQTLTDALTPFDTANQNKLNECRVFPDNSSNNNSNND